MAHSSVWASAWCFFGSASRTLVRRWFQHLCSARVGYCSPSAAHKPRCPLALVHRQGLSPRLRRSRKIIPQDSLDSRWPLSTASTTFCPLVSTPIITNRAAWVSSSEKERKSGRHLPRGSARRARRSVAGPDSPNRTKESEHGWLLTA